MNTTLNGHFAVHLDAFPWTIHAEDAAFRKLPSLPRKRLKKIDLLVIRTSKTGVLGLSKPCTDCLNVLQKLPEKGYSLQKIYYSTRDGIEETTLKRLLEDDNHHISKYHKEHMNMKRSS